MREFVLGNASMRREPRSHQRPMALAGVHVGFTVDVKYEGETDVTVR